jgi:Calx-beta domain
MKKIFLLINGCFLFVLAFSQNVGIGTPTPNNYAILDIKSDTKGILIPRMDSSSRKQIPNIRGLLVYDTSTNTLWHNNGSVWVNYYIIPGGITNGDMLYWNGTQWVLLPAAIPGQILTINTSGLPVWQNPAPLLYSIKVTPVTPAIIVGQTQQFTATGTYWDASTANITSSVNWTSSNTTVATINSSGLAITNTVGSSIIKAKLGIISDSTTLTVSAPTISINDVSINEGSSGTTSFVFTVTLSAPAVQTITVNFITANGTATGGFNSTFDYTPITGMLTFLPGQNSKTITVSVNGDVVTESNETFFVNLSGANNATILDGQGIGTIINDD